MSNSISVLVEAAVKPGQLETFKALLEEVSADVQANEPGTLVYQHHFSNDGSTCHHHERYMDSAAVMVHLGTFNKYGERYMACADFNRMVVYGDISDEVKEAFDGFSAQYMPTTLGFTR